jgi:hypothetical protein
VTGVALVVGNIVGADGGGDFFGGVFLKGRELRGLLFGREGFVSADGFGAFVGGALCGDQFARQIRGEAELGECRAGGSIVTIREEFELDVTFGAESGLKLLSEFRKCGFAAVALFA